ncbi:MAG: acyl-CoA mutase large subunit family protein [Planctomycetota bacterium]|jgi:methylmalonyl-CoA mutase N-terminal domain/subunit
MDRRTWEEKVYGPFRKKHPERKDSFATSSGIEPEPVYGDEGLPGVPPYTRGILPTMYRGRLWTMRQYAGFTSARASNERYRALLAQGVTGLSIAFDLPTQIGYDSDSAEAMGEVGRVGVPVNSLRDMEVLLDSIPLDKVTVSMTINSTASLLLCMLIAVARKRGIDPSTLGGTVQNDLLKEYVARGTYRFPVEPSMRLITDTFRYCSDNLPRWNPISISGYHMREAGATAVQEVAFTLANGIAYVRAAVDAGLDVDRFARRLSFFFNAHNHLFEEVAKFRAARRMWARIMKQRFGAKEERSMLLRFHTQTAGSTLQGRQIDVNVVRTAMQALAAVLGGTQSLHTNSRDEALALPTEESAKLALRTQQVLAFESGVTEVVDPLGGSPYVEALTDEIESRATELIERIDRMGGAVKATAFMRREIERSAYEAQRRIERGEDVVVGLNRYEEEEDVSQGGMFEIDAAEGERVKAELRQLRESRDAAATDAALDALRAACGGAENLFPFILSCVEAYATVGEICGAMEEVFGAYREVT